MKNLIALGFTMLAFTSQVSAQEIESSEIARAALRECYVSNIVSLGKGNQEPASTLLSVLETICQDQYTALGFSYFAEKSLIMREARARDLKEIQSAATIALIKSRSSL